ncbi:hypothetical protein ACPV3A_08650 [Paenibacillus sp. Dod16]|uniref:hypothetical protein n=1 Tax=Paenibacillus TaxID=44249 RepID=UPI001C7D8388|nr:hypothetical protein [Paenibacillus lautus]MBX4150678.1 hypothetical protein [Paenibacillus lautus]
MKMIKLRIPLFVFALGISMFLSNLVRGAENIAYLVILISLVAVFEKTKISEKKVNILYGVLIAITGLAIEFLTEPGDYLQFFS